MTPSDSSGLAARLGALSPEKQALLARKLAERSAQRGDAGDGRIPRRTADGPAPLSHAQELLWLFEQMTPGTATYNIPLARRVRGPLQVDALRRACDELVARHESLRTRFVELEGAPRQMVDPPARVPVELHDLRDRPDGLRQGEAEALLRDAAARPFDLSAGTGPRVLLVTLGAEESLLLLVVHHVVFDGVSGVVLWRELGALYDAALRGRPAELAPLPIQVADVAAWERDGRGAERFAPDLAFWRGELDGAPAGVDLLTDFPRPPGAVGPGARYAALLPAATRDAVRALGAAHEATLFMTMMAGFQALLHRYSGQADIVVGTPMVGRERPETAGLIGYLANALALRARFENDPGFGALLRQVRQRTLRALEHQNVPYEELVRELRAGLSTGEQSLFNIVLTVQDGSAAPPRLGAATLEPLSIDLDATRFDLRMSAADTGAGLEVVVQYRSDLFRAETVARLVSHLERLLRSAARAPETPVSRLPLMNDAERTLVVTTWNDTAAPYPQGRTIHDLIREQAARTPDAIAVISGADRVSYAELEARAEGLAARLRQLGVTPGAMVGILAERTAETVVGILAILKAGAAYVPLDPAHPAERLGFIARDSGFRLLIGRRPVQDVLGDAVEVTCVPPDATAPIDSAAPPVRVPGDAIAYVIYTSGSTGRPKGVLVTHDNLMVSTWARVLRYPDPVGRYLLLSCFAFDSSVAGLFWTLVQGGALVVPREGEHLDATALCTLLREERITHLLAVPSFYYEVLGAAGPEDLAALRVAMTGGDWCPVELIERHRALAPRAGFYTEYGPTETTVWCSVQGIEPGTPIPRVTIGNPMPNYRMYILDGSGEPLPIGVPGEIYIGGRGVSQGYLNRPELNDAQFLPDPFNPEPGARMYRTGERGRWLAHGEIDFLGRIDFQVKVRGYRVELREIEATLAAHPSVAQAAVVLRPERGGEIVAYVVARLDDERPRAGAAAYRDDLRTHLARHLPDYMVPSAIVLLETMPVTSSGKLERSALPAPDHAAPVEDAPPEGPIEEVIAAVWREALQVERIGRTTSFFDLGGHSLLVTRVVAALAKLFRIQLPIRAMFEAPTVAGVAAALRAREPAPGQTERVARLVLKVQAQSAPMSGETTNTQTGMYA
ncbi:MAG: non-ribosomal peptide synthetase [Gemmatimonadales bacterium]